MIQIKAVVILIIAIQIFKIINLVNNKIIPIQIKILNLNQM